MDLVRLLFVLTSTTIVTCDTDGNWREDMLRDQCTFLNYGKWINGTCVCVKPCMKPPSCNEFICNGGRRDYFAPSDAERCIDCPVGRSGTCCEIVTCLHGGKKTDKETCDCRGTGYTGTYCENKKVNCQNGDKVWNENACDCYRGYTGTNCERLDCENGGYYTGGICECPSGYKGKTCQNIVCHNGGSEWASGCHCSFMFADEERCGSLTDIGWLIVIGVPLLVLICCSCCISHHVRQKRAKALYNQPVFLDVSGSGVAIPSAGGTEAVPLAMPGDSLVPKGLNDPNERPPPSYDEATNL